MRYCRRFDTRRRRLPAQHSQPAAAEIFISPHIIRFLELRRHDYIAASNITRHHASIHTAAIHLSQTDTLIGRAT